MSREDIARKREAPAAMASSESTIKDTSDNVQSHDVSSRSDIDLDSVSKWWDFVYREGHCVELRMLTQSSEASGYFNNKAKFIATVSRLNGKGQIYTTINPVPEDFLARGMNRMRGTWKAVKIDHRTKEVKRLTTTADTDIRMERIFAIDIDPVRPADVASTDEELAHAKDLALAVQGYLRELGVASVIGMSGNGYYVLVKLKEQAMTAEVADRRKAILKYLVFPVTV